MAETVAREDIMRRLTQVILKINDLERFLSAITQMVVEAFAVKWVTLSLLDEATGQYILKASSKSSEEMPEDIEEGKKDNAASWLKERQKVLSRRLVDEFGKQMDPELIEELNKIDTSVSMPLFIDDQLIGVLNLGTKANNRTFTKKDLESLSELAQLFASLIYQAIYHHRLLEQRLHHQNILDNLVSGIVAIDPEDKITVFNRTAEKILGFKAEQVLDKDVRMLQANLAQLLLDTLHTAKPYRREELYVLPENTLIGVSTSQFFDEAGELLGACMVFSSISEVKKKEQVVRRRNLEKYWSSVANSLAHEVKNSIVATKAFTELFPDKHDDAEFRQSLYSMLKRDMEKLDKFSDKVLNFAQAQELVMQPCQITDIMNAAIDSALEEKDIGEVSIEKKYTHDLKPLSGDYHQLKETFLHLVSNALEAMDKKGTLTISIEQEQDSEMLSYNLPQTPRNLPEGEIIVVKIADTGCGILPQHMSLLFDPFYSTKAGKTGLGLAFARKVIERHHGIISAQSKPNKGSTFWVCLPVDPEAK